MRIVKFLLIFIILGFGVLGLVKSSLAASPVLNFSDLTDGPKSGLGDGLGQGAIVTIWGNNLGSSQGSSRVYFKDSTGVSREAAYVYEWANATRHAGHPSDLYTYHKMQTIAFSIPFASADGAGKIYVTVGGVNSNELDFTIRAGNIYWVSGTGLGANAGTFASPKRLISNYYRFGSCSPGTPGVMALMSPGDIAYHLGGTEQCPEGTNIDIIVQEKICTEANPCAIIAYPGRDLRVVAINSHYALKFENAKWWTFSKIYITTDQEGVTGSLPGLRLAGSSITDITQADGQSAAIVGGAGYEKWLGNYIFNWGGPTTSPLHHVTYISHRNDYNNTTDCIPNIRESGEMGWNYLKDNWARGGIHFYDENMCGGYTGTWKVHDNVVTNQAGHAFGFSYNCYKVVPIQYTCGGKSWAPNGISVNFDFYNNIIVNSGLPWLGGSYGNSITVGNSVTDNTTQSSAYGTLNAYNNTIYGYGPPAGGAAAAAIGNYRLRLYDQQYVWNWVNNLVVDTVNNPFYDPVAWTNPTIHTNNLWYNGGDGNPTAVPSWDTNPLSSNPLFTNAAGGDFSLQSGSPARNVGYNTTAIAPRDFFGVLRSATPSLGAFEYASGGTPPSDTTPPSVSVTTPISGATVSGSIIVSANASDNVGVIGVQFKLDGANLGLEDTLSPYSIIWNTASASNGSHTLTALARDTAGNQTTSLGVSVTVNNVSDTQSPTVPINLSATAVSSSQINLSWTASTDNVGVTGYRIYRGGTQIGTSASNSYSDSGLSPSTNYSYTVSAYDAVGNLSGQSSSASATTQSSSAGSGLIGYWKFDENSGTMAYDSSGNSNTGTLVNGPVWTSGRVGQAISFDGVNDYVSVADSSSLSFINNALTITAWVKLNSLPTDEIPILRKNLQWSIEFENATTIRNLINTDGLGGWTSGNDETFAFQTNTWYFWTFVYDGSKVTHMINSQQVGSTHPVTGNIIDNSSAVEMGRYNGYLNGLIDEVRIYNRALSASEIQTLYSGASDTTPPAPPSGVTIN